MENEKNISNGKSTHRKPKHNNNPENGLRK